MSSVILIYLSRLIYYIVYSYVTCGEMLFLTAGAANPNVSIDVQKKNALHSLHWRITRHSSLELRLSFHLTIQEVQVEVQILWILIFREFFPSIHFFANRLLWDSWRKSWGQSAAHCENKIFNNSLLVSAADTESISLQCISLYSP